MGHLLELLIEFFFKQFENMDILLLKTLAYNVVYMNSLSKVFFKPYLIKPYEFDYLIHNHKLICMAEFSSLLTRYILQAIWPSGQK